MSKPVHSRSVSSVRLDSSRARGGKRLVRTVHPLSERVKQDAKGRGGVWASEFVSEKYDRYRLHERRQGMEVGPSTSFSYMFLSIPPAPLPVSSVLKLRRRRWGSSQGSMRNIRVFVRSAIPDDKNRPNMSHVRFHDSALYCNPESKKIPSSEAHVNPNINGARCR
jgi:hypothetical protein